MLKSLQIKDYALIQNINVEFGKGLNIITGETGAGKSILIGALGLLLGERAYSESVRKGAKKSFIEGIFYVGNNPKVKRFLLKNEFEETNELIVRREISLKGSNRCFINDAPVQLSTIKEIGDLLIDLHGQHDHQSLLKVETHIDFLDQFCNIKNELNEFKNLKKELQSLLNQKRELIKNEESLKEKLDLNSFRLKEINGIAPLKGEDVEIERELNLLENSETLFDLSTRVYNSTYDGDNNIYDHLVDIQNGLYELSRIDGTLKEKFDEFSSAVEMIKDVGEFVRDYRDKIEIDPKLLEDLRERAGALNLLKKKYGGTLEKVLEFKEHLERELSIVENFSDRINELESKANEIRTKVSEIALKLSNKRKKDAKKIEQYIEEALEYLGIPSSKFDIRFNIEDNPQSEIYCEIGGKRFQLQENGIDIVEFYISTNKGEDTKPLVKTASGGEISRIMLSIKSVMAKKEMLPLLVFDEIDTGISGRIAEKVGKILKSLAKSHQIISITHLPQIAACAEHHYSVEKVTENDRVVSSIKKLSEGEKLEELAKLLSGEKTTKKHLEVAKELLMQANQ